MFLIIGRDFLNDIPFLLFLLIEWFFGYLPSFDIVIVFVLVLVVTVAITRCGKNYVRELSLGRVCPSFLLLLLLLLFYFEVFTFLISFQKYKDSDKDHYSTC